MPEAKFRTMISIAVEVRLDGNDAEHSSAGYSQSEGKQCRKLSSLRLVASKCRAYVRGTDGGPAGLEPATIRLEGGCVIGTAKLTQSAP
jgi:hypothetical protein